MESEDHNIKANCYDLKAQLHSRRVFHSDLVTRPWRALVLVIDTSILGASAGFNLVDALDGIVIPRWDSSWSVLRYYSSVISLVAPY